MATLNKVYLVGNLTKDPELRFIPSGQAVANLRMAVNRKWKDKQGEWKEDVCYVTVVVWGKSAEACGENLQKGASVMVEGRLQSRSWETEDGQKRSVMEVVSERVQFLGGKKNGANGSGHGQAAPAADEPGSEGDPSDIPQGTDDIPF
jgi:single-strand DNA-binding protein